MEVKINIPEEYLKEFSKVIKDKSFEKYMQEHIFAVLEATCPLPEKLEE